MDLISIWGKVYLNKITGKFFNIQDENRNFHPAQQAIFFNNKTYFVSFNDGGLYQMDTTITSYNYDETDINNEGIATKAL